MGKIRLSGIAPDDYDEYDSLYGGTEKIQRNDKKQNNDEEIIQQSQGMPAGWRKGDSHIGKQKKARNYGN